MLREREILKCIFILQSDQHAVLKCIFILQSDQRAVLKCIFILQSDQRAVLGGVQLPGAHVGIIAGGGDQVQSNHI